MNYDLSKCGTEEELSELEKQVAELKALNNQLTDANRDHNKENAKLREALKRIAKCEFSVTQMQKNMEIAKKALGDSQ